MSYAAGKDIVPTLLRLRRIHEDSGTTRVNQKGKGKGNVTRPDDEKIEQVPEAYEYGTVTVLGHSQSLLRRLSMNYR